MKPYNINKIKIYKKSTKLKHIFLLTVIFQFSFISFLILNKENTNKFINIYKEKIFIKANNIKLNFLSIYHNYINKKDFNDFLISTNEKNEKILNCYFKNDKNNNNCEKPIKILGNIKYKHNNQRFVISGLINESDKNIYLKFNLKDNRNAKLYLKNDSSFKLNFLQNIFYKKFNLNSNIIEKVNINLNGNNIGNKLIVFSNTNNNIVSSDNLQYIKSELTKNNSKYKIDHIKWGQYLALKEFFTYNLNNDNIQFSYYFDKNNYIQPTFKYPFIKRKEISNIYGFKYLNNYLTNCSYICSFFNNLDYSRGISKNLYLSYIKYLNIITSNVFLPNLQKDLIKNDYINKNNNITIGDLNYLFNNENIALLNSKSINSFKERFILSNSIKPFIYYDKVTQSYFLENQRSIFPQLIKIKCESNIYDEFIIKYEQKQEILLDNSSNCKQLNKLKISVNENDFNHNLLLNNSRLFINELVPTKIFNKSHLILNDKEYLKIDKNNININKDTFIVNKNIILPEKLNINIQNQSTLYIVNSNLDNKNSEVFINGINKDSGSVVIENSIINLKHFEGSSLNNPNNNLRILYGGINILNSEFEIKSLDIKNSKSEDAINFINSDIVIEKVNLDSIISDGIDSDFSNINIGKITCNNINNDCLDLSFSTGNVSMLNSEGIGDKVVSAGENTIFKIDIVNSSNSEIGIVSKDGSNLQVQKFISSSTKVPIAIFLKKFEYKSPKLQIEEMNKELLSKSLISNDSKLTIKDEIIKGKYSSSEINDLLYGEKYGVKTVR